MARINGTFIGFMVLVLAASGCSSHFMRVPKVSGAKLPNSAAARVISRLAECGSTVESFRGLARASLVQKEERAAFRYAIVFSKPDKLRIEALPTAAVYTLSLLLTNEHNLLYLDATSKTAHRGPVAVPMLNRFLGVPLLPPDLMSLLTACAPTQISSAEASLVYEDSQRGVLQVSTKGMLLEVSNTTFDPQRAFVINSFDDRVALLIEWSDYRDVQGQQLPGTVKITIPEHSVTLELNFTSSEINGKYPDKLFQAVIPEGYDLR